MELFKNLCRLLLISCVRYNTKNNMCPIDVAWRLLLSPSYVGFLYCFATVSIGSVCDWVLYVVSISVYVRLKLCLIGFVMCLFLITSDWDCVRSTHSVVSVLLVFCVHLSPLLYNVHDYVNAHLEVYLLIKVRNMCHWL